jgi:hypothetical protein
MGNLLRIDLRTLPQIFGWYDAANVAGFGQALPADGATVATWKDLSGQGHDLTMANTIFKVGVAGINGVNPGLRFNGTTSNGSVTPAGTIPRPLTLVCVLKNSVADDAAAHDAVCFNNSRIGFQLDWLTNNVLTWFDDTTVVNAGPAGDTTSWHICTVMAQPTGTLSRYTVDGTLATRAGATGTNANSAFFVGSSAIGTAFWNGDIAEAVLFGGDFQPCVLDAVRQALAEKYGLLASQTLAGQ